MATNKELQTITRRGFLETLHPDLISRNLTRVKTVSDALKLADQPEAYPSLAALRRDYGSEKIEAMIKLYLIYLSEDVNLKRPLKDRQIDNIAREVVEEYYMFTIADIHVIFRRARTGEYGAFFESLDMAKVMTWFREYFHERCSIAEQESINSRYRDPNDPRQSELARQHFDRLEKQFKATGK